MQLHDISKCFRGHFTFNNTCLEKKGKCTACLMAAITSLDWDIWGTSWVEAVTLASKSRLVAIGLILLCIARRRHSHPNAHGQSNPSVPGVKKIFKLWSVLLLHNAWELLVAGKAQQWGKLGCPHLFTSSRNTVSWSLHRDSTVLDPAPILL